MKCEFCNKPIPNDSPEFMVKQLSLVGYYPMEFCNKGCFLSWVLKEFKRYLVIKIK